MLKKYNLKFKGISRELPFIKVDSGQYLVENEPVCFGSDIRFTDAVARELAEKIRPFNPEILLTIETKPLAIGYEICKQLKLQNMVVVRKNSKEAVFAENVNSITGGRYVIGLKSYQAQLLKGKRAVLFDDTVSTCSTMLGLNNLAMKAEAKVVCISSVWIEGDEYRHFFANEIEQGRFINLLDFPILKEEDVC